MNLTTIIAALALLIPCSARAGSGLCPPAGTAPTVRVATEDGGLRYDLTRSASEITSLGGERMGGAVTRGLREVRVSTDIKAKIRSTPARGGGVCVEPVDVLFTVRMDTVIYIDAGYAPGTCRFAAVDGHERTHVSIDRRVYNLWVPEFERALGASVSGGVFPVWSAAESGGRALTLDAINAGMGRAMDGMANDRDRLNAEIDTPESYETVHSQCADW